MLASLRSVAAVWKEARSQVESLDERIRALLEANAPALLGIEGAELLNGDRTVLRRMDGVWTAARRPPPPWSWPPATTPAG